MIDLISTSDQIEVVTTGTVTFDVLGSFTDRTINNEATALGRQPTAIVAAGTAVVVSPPAVNNERGVAALIIHNKHATQATPTTVQTNIGGVLSVLWTGTLNASEVLEYNNETGKFEVLKRRVFTDVQSFTTVGAFTWIKPTTFTPHTVVVVLYGAGGGGSAANSTVGVSIDGGIGGGGGAYVQRTYRAQDLADNVPGIVGLGGEGGIGLLNSQSLTDPTAGGESSFGQGKLKVFAGGGGAGTGGGVSADVAGGGGGGTGSSGTAVAGSAGGRPGLGTALTSRRGGSGPNATASSASSYGEQGGGGGGQIVFQAVGNDDRFPGGTSIFGGAGGGVGGMWDGVLLAGSTGGVPNTCVVFLGTGGAAAGTNGAAPTAGADGADGHSGRGGGGGGGGGATQTAAVNGKDGGKGGSCGGGGGGGGACLDTGIAGNGGNGGNGAVFVFSY